MASTLVSINTQQKTDKSTIKQNQDADVTAQKDNGNR